MSDDLSTWLRDELSEMASTASVDMELWDRFSNHVLEAADALEKLRARIEDIAELYNSAQLTPVPKKMLKDAIDEDYRARITALEAALIAVYRHMDMDGTEIDCCDLQETLIEHGVLVAYTATEPCGDCCPCAEYGPEFLMTCYRLNDDLRAARAALEKK